MRKRAVVLALLVLLILVVGLSDVLAVGPDGSSASSSPYLYVNRITLTMSQIPGGSRAVASVWIRDSASHAVAGAAVKAIFNKPGKLPVIGQHNTTSSGRASWTMNSKSEGIWAVCVVWVAKTGYWYNPGMNHDTCQMVWYP
jgi:hypothetical protein